MVRRFLICFVPCLVLLSLVAGWLGFSEHRGRQAIQAGQEQAEIQVATGAVCGDLRSVVNDVLLLADQPSLRRLLDSGEAQNLQSNLLAFVRCQKIYDQARYLDESGMERVRVNYNGGHPAVVPEEQLQSKADRYYFKETLAMPAGQVWVSPLDLNIEHNAIEQPLKPMIRLGTPVFDNQGRKRGIVILNYLAAEFLGRLDQRTAGAGRIMLLNSQGYWLKGSAEDEWGFMYPERQERTFARRFPAAWERIRQVESGQFAADGALFSFATVRPIWLGQEDAVARGASRAAAPLEWKIVSYLPIGLAAGGMARAAWVLLWAWAGCLVAAAVSCWLLAAWAVQRKKAEMALRDSEAKFRSISTAAQDAVIMIDERGAVSFWNDAAARMFGILAGEAMGQNLHEMVVPERFRGVHQLRFGQFLHSGTGPAVGRLLELTARRKDGTEFPIELTVSPVQLGGRWNAVGILRDISQRKAMELQLRQAARTDRLTGLPNRALLEERIEQAIKRSRRRRDQHFAVLFLDFDRFKIINDSLGHRAGDQLLCEISRRLQHAIRETDALGRQDAADASGAEGATAARLGGDEFVILLENLQAPQDARVVAERVLDALSGPIRLEGQRSSIVSTASIGIVTSDYGYGRAEDVLRDADTAMYEAKLQGRGRAVWFDGSMRDRVQRKLAMESDLRKALDQGELFLEYQPILSLESGEVESVEALCRWQHPQAGRVSPGGSSPSPRTAG